MAITILQQPSTHMPAFNANWWEASSTQSAQPNFQYTVICTDMITGTQQTYDCPKNPSDLLRFDSGEFASQFITQLNPSGLYGFQRNTGAIRQIRVNIGETYGATPAYTAGVDVDYIVWNGSLPFLEFQSYAVANYLYSQANNIQLITNNKHPSWSFGPSSAPTANYSYDENNYTGRSSYLYFLSSADGDVKNLTIEGYSAAGVLLATSVITNPYNTGTTYTDKYVFIDVGYDGLLNMPGAQISSGTSPIPVSTFAYWIVYDSSDWLPVAGIGAPYIWPLKKIVNVCEQRFDVINCHYLSKYGSFESQLFNKLSERTSDSQSTEFSQLPYNQNTGAYDYGASVENVHSVSEKSRIKINTDWLTENEVTRLKQMASTQKLFIDAGDSGGYKAMKIVGRSYVETRRYNEKQTQKAFELEYTHTDYSQRL